jgi:N utilization substance protein A
MKSDFILAFNEIAETRKLPREVILDALSAALVSAYRRNSGAVSGQHVEARIDEKTGEADIWVEKEVVEDVANEYTEVLLEKAREVDPDAQLGDMVLVEDTPENFGRIAAQTAKQVILQRMREAEREAQYQEYMERVGDLITGTVQSDSGGVVAIGLGRTEAILPRNQQMPGERYRMHDKVRAYVMEVRKTNRGPQIVVSRTHRNMLRRLLEYEVPEIYNGTVEIKSIAREPGARSKVAVAALQEGADPVGACVGMRGVRIQSIVKELNNEKIDVIEWSPEPSTFISKALSPARVSSVFLDDDPDDGRTAIVIVPDDQLSLAIGREGQNARLAAKLTGWRIDIKSVTEGTQEAYARLSEPEMEALTTQYAEVIAQIGVILQKKEEKRPIMPEDYLLMIDFVKTVENYRLGLLEDRRVVRRAEIEEALAKVPAAAYKHPLEETDIPQRVYSVLDDAGYSTVGQVMEQYYLNPQKLLDIHGFGPAMLGAVETMINTIEFDASAAEAAKEAGAEALAELAEGAEQLAEGMELPADEAAVEAEAAQEGADEADGMAEVPAAGVRVEVDEAEERARAERAALVARMSVLDQLAEPEAVDDGVVEPEMPPSEALEELPADAPERPVEKLEGADEAGMVGVDEEFDGELIDSQQDRRRAKQRRRELVFDEDLGRVVSTRKRKPGRARGKWADVGALDDFEEFDDLDDFE